jgi:hypothetical protein
MLKDDKQLASNGTRPRRTCSGSWPMPPRSAAAGARLSSSVAFAIACLQA